jgi:hypothetical protein
MCRNLGVLPAQSGDVSRRAVRDSTDALNPAEPTLHEGAGRVGRGVNVTAHYTKNAPDGARRANGKRLGYIPGIERASMTVIELSPGVLR